MHFSKITFILGALPFTFAAYGAADASSSSTAVTPSITTSTSPSDPTHTILVGAGGELTFSPNETKADVNTTLEFHFYPRTHSVAQAAFASPCNGSGFFSGPIATTSEEGNLTVFSVLVNDTKPIWFYCGFPGHCEGGMVGAVNVPSDNTKTLEMFSDAAKKLAKNATENPQGTVGGTLAPVKEDSASGSSTTSTAGSSATAATTGTTASSSSGAGISGVGWMTFAGAVGVAGLLCV
ncbi:c3824a22-6209-4452-ba89-b2e0614bc564 [Sclerotinia trifoliorum]|uniref:C3824a22-6209-4452-ba89-b2e0614bc564 n=1 Tax=Sclerotinia trifoliorum TaxID=28548 RepID=A0A8H2W3N4_9HELO|nr:c3824a22-6209-4452-ba89-b2e0614bc564 [Sclerotinia trifoliorum]